MKSTQTADDWVASALLADLWAWAERENLSTQGMDDLLMRLRAVLEQLVPPERLAQIVDFGDVATPTPLPARAPMADRYVLRDELGRGGMAVVFRAWDTQMRRTVALKRPLPRLGTRGLGRFRMEVLLTAQLNHPGIIPVYDQGWMDGRQYYTMPEIHGRDLKEVITTIHEASGHGPWRPDPHAWTFRQVLDVLRRVCEAVAYAHDQGIVHRDLKPQNIIVGSLGEAFVADWGVARLLDKARRTFEERGLDVHAHVDGTLWGQRVGTLNYMAPEQVLGDLERVGPPSDVFALGAILCTILTGRPPFRRDTARETADAVVQCTPPDIHALCERAGRTAPDELVALQREATRRMPEDRTVTAADFAARLSSWLEGARLRDEALRTVSAADALYEETIALSKRAERLDFQAKDLLRRLEPHDDEGTKRPAWMLEDESARLQSQVSLNELRILHLLQSALRQVPDLPEASRRIAAHHQRQHRAAEQRRDMVAAAGEAFMLESYDTERRFAAYLEGMSSVTLHTDPPGAEVQLYEYRLIDRRLHPVFVRFLGRTPLIDAPIRHGSYQLRVKAEGFAEMRYPVAIGRDVPWDGIAPGAAKPQSIALIRRADLDSDECRVPAGWFVSGGDPEAYDGLPERRLWCPDFSMQKFPVTNRQYIVFLNAMVAAGDQERARRLAPHQRGSAGKPYGGPLYGQGADGRFHLLERDPEGDVWDLDWPVIMVDWWGARAYAKWWAEQTGLPWRLPSELEWEKAARGVDGRMYPWGDWLDPSWCLMVESRKAPGPVRVDTFPVDESPYGVRGLAGNVRDWCADDCVDDTPAVQDERVVPLVELSDDAEQYRRFRGGSWRSPDWDVRCAGRLQDRPTVVNANVGFRLVRSIGPQPTGREHGT